MFPSFQCKRNSVICGLHSLSLHLCGLACRNRSGWLSLTLSSPSAWRDDTESLFYPHTRTHAQDHVRIPNKAYSRVGRLRNETDKNSSALDGSILKSFMNKGFPLKEEERSSGMESVSPCRSLAAQGEVLSRLWQRFIQTSLWFCTSSDRTDPILAKITTSLIRFVKLKRELWESNICSFFLSKKVL